MSLVGVEADGVSVATGYCRGREMRLRMLPILYGLDVCCDDRITTKFDRPVDICGAEGYPSYLAEGHEMAGSSGCV